MTATVVLVHGAGGGAWQWDKTVAELDVRGIRNVAVDLPTSGANDASVDATHDVEHVRQVIDGIEGPVILAGNSYGGVVISGVTMCPNVKHLVYLAAGMPRADEPWLGDMSSAATDEFNTALQFGSDGLISFDAEVVVKTSMRQAAPEDHDRWRSKRLPVSFGTDMTRSFDAVAWETVPSTYVVCTDDGALDPDAQRAWAKERATHVLEWPSDHCPPISAPAAVADLLERLATEAS